MTASPRAPPERVGRAGGLAAKAGRGLGAAGGLPPLPETALQQRWAAQAFAAWCAVIAEPMIVDRGGPESQAAPTRLRVLFPGRCNGGAGPDFLEALLLTCDGRILRGDVEVHRRTSDWWRHGHHRDPAYRRVLLHVVGIEEPAPDLGGGPAPGAEPHFTSVLAAHGSACLGEERAAGAALPCEGLVGRIGATAVAARLRALGQGRLAEKSERIARALAAGADLDDLALRQLLIALGQGGNGAALAAIAEGLCLQSLPLSAGVEAIQSALRARLLEDPENMTPRVGLPASARRPAVRPANRLERRLRAAALLLHRYAQKGAQGGLAVRLGAPATQPVATAVAALRAPPWLGSERALQLLVDVAFPLALVQAETMPVPDRGQPSLIARWLDLPGASYRRTAALRSRLAADALPLRRNGDAQALLALERAYCRHGACAICPLARLERGAAGGRGGRGLPPVGGGRPDISCPSG